MVAFFGVLLIIISKFQRPIFDLKIKKKILTDLESKSNKKKLQKKKRIEIDQILVKILLFE
jgi:hypothetical protein